MIFGTWEGFVRTIIVGILAYVALVFLLRVSGKRTLSKWNAFDFVVTVALGSTLATILLSKDVPLSEGVAAFFILISLQYLVTSLSVRSAQVRRMIKAEPTLLFYQGQYLHQVMQRERIPEEEIRAAVRNQGLASMRGVNAVVLETDGSFAVIQGEAESPSTMQDVANFAMRGKT